MFLRAPHLILSPTDLSAFLGCRHRTGLDLAVAHGLLAKPEWRDAMGDALRERGQVHEQLYVAWLRGQGLDVLDLAAGPDEGFRRDVDALALTRVAMQQGVPVIYQALLEGAGWRGYADILRRVPTPSDLGAWSYEVHDTKLARDTRGGTVLQLLAYSELVAGIQGTWPEHFRVVTPALASEQLDASSSPFLTHTYRLADYAAYYRRVKAQLLRALNEGPELLQTSHYPEPVEQCEVCRWWTRCNRRRRNDDHLAFIAGIARTQRTEFVAHHVPTLSAAAALGDPLPFIPTRGSRDTYERLRDQARLQHRQRTNHQPVHELLPLQPDMGLSRLPAPSPGDIFLDLEGARFAREGGREYLFGIWTEGAYQGWWAHTDAEEQAAFEAVMDLIETAWHAHPGMHVYHFGHYEASTFKRLMGRHATRADTLDRLLRGERLVDLYSVVRQALRAGVESYSIKQLEQFYGFTREVPLGDASQHLQAIELALEAQAPASIPPEARAAVRGYNRDDCRSTEALREWLEGLRAEVVAHGTDVTRPEVKADAAPEKVSELEAQQDAARAALLDGLPAEASEPSHAQHPRWLFAHLLGWHRREDKAQYWERYRLNELGDDQLLDERQAIAGLQFMGRVREVTSAKTGRPTGSVVDRYSYPAQDVEIRKGKLLRTGPTAWGDIEAHDWVARTVDVKKGPSAVGQHPTSAFQADVVGTDAMQKSLLRLCAHVTAVSEATSEPRRQDDSPVDALSACATDLLFRRAPRLSGGAFEPGGDQSSVEHAVRLATQLDRTTLAVQGPPGAGKTYVGAQMIRALVKAGKRVGVVAVSHKVIRNLLDAVGEQAGAADESVRMGHKGGEDDAVASDGARVRPFDGNPDALAALAAREIDVLGGTAWLWARPEFAASVDVLFVDEAGQMSLANALAVSPAASSLVLLGDPQQLEQPQKGSHPDGVDVSALQHVLGEASTMPEGRGLFLPETWRLAPEVCAFTSELFYEGKLQSRPGLERQRLVGAPGLEGAGLRWVPVTHDGNQNWSAEEVDVVAALVDRLLAPGSQWIDSQGRARQLEPPDLLVVAPYNAHVNRLSDRLSPRGVRVGTVDKFQGQEAPVVIYSMATSRPEDAPRGMEFLYSLNRLNVATSRARCAALVVASPRLVEPECRTPGQMRLANALCRYVESAAVVI
ncbi:MAG: TM0106 family RecB-like putative nuclease [Acidobacteriota bacterium]